MLVELLLVALGGAPGGIGRHALAAAVACRFGDVFPWGTLVVNASGAAAIGVLAALLLTPDARAVTQPTAWAELALGVLGSYSTGLPFSLQTLVLARSCERLRAGLNVIASTTLCLCAAAAGYAGMLALAPAR